MPFRQGSRFVLVLCLALATISWPGEAFLPALARATCPDEVIVTTSDEGVWLEWCATDSQRRPAWPLVAVGGWQLPVTSIALRVVDHPAQPERAPPQVVVVESIPYQGTPQVVEPPIPRTLDGDERPDLLSPPQRTMPTEPVIVLRDGWQRGERLLVVGVSLLFEQAGTLRQATRVRALVPGTTPLSPADTGPVALARQMAPRLSLSPAPPANTAIASSKALRIQTASAGFQHVLLGALAEALGVKASSLKARTLRLWHNGQPVALEVVQPAKDTPAKEQMVRFYAPPPGDRWNATDTYWLTTSEEGTAQRIKTRTVSLDQDAKERKSAIEQGVWRSNTYYDSTVPGPDGDHWFAANLRTGPGLEAASLTVALTPTLPLASGEMVLTIRGSAYLSGTHSLAVQMAGATSRVRQQWSGTGDWEQVFRLSPTGKGAQLWTFDVSLLPGFRPDGVEIDSIVWERPVKLDFKAGGGAFQGVAGEPYRLQNMPEGALVYDITNERKPLRLQWPEERSTIACTGAEACSYLVVDATSVYTPAHQAHQPVRIHKPLDVEALYIGPAEFEEALEPLIAMRKKQGYTAAFVNVQSIYDLWSYGQVSPDAVRNFLRHAAATWDTPPLAVTLVGDGTFDPLNYNGHNHTNFVPPYLAMVDPWIGETACETCYAQLDGDDPLSDMLPDVWLGRLPAKSTDELAAVVSKLRRYEQGGLGGLWRARNVYLSDNYRDAYGNTDGAGDFALFSDTSAERQPAWMDIRRLYYDPSPSYLQDPWREPDSERAHQDTLELLNQGAAFVNYAGHSHYWQLAVTDPAISPSYLLGLYDVDTLTNGDRLPVSLQMTCLTGSFHHSSPSGTTIDERLLLHPGGGSIAVWGSSGLGVAHGQDSLQSGFYNALWSSSGKQAPPLGTLIHAGYSNLFRNGNCCYDSIRTFGLLGDPLTRPRAGPVEPHVLVLPLVLR